MKKIFFKRMVAATMALMMVFSKTAAADSWYQEGENWFVRIASGVNEKEGIEYRTGWYQDDKKDWYYLEPSPDAPIRGALQSGWFFDGENWYFLNPVHDGYFGRRFTDTWQWVDGYCYCFDKEGKLIVNGMTPDQYTVNQDGQWTINGVVQFIPGKGIITKSSQTVSGNYSGGGSSGGGFSSGSSGGGSGGMGDFVNDQIVTLTVIYQDADTNDILDLEKLKGKSGEIARIRHREFGGYAILNSQPTEVIFADKDTEVYVLYRKTLFRGAIEIQYIDIESSSLIASKNVSGLVGEDYIVHVPVIDGYKAVARQEDFTVMFLEEKQIARVEYRKIRSGEESDQMIVMADNVKVAQADTKEEEAILKQICDGIFDYQQYKDGTVEFTVYNDNPILKYALEGKYKANDIIYIEPNEDFAAGMTFIYQSHDDNYSGLHEGYNAGNCEVIHGYQASPFVLFAPGTNMEMQVSSLTDDDVESRTEWSLFGSEQAGDSVRSMRKAGRKKDEESTDNVLIKAIPFHIDKDLLKKILPQAGKNFIDKYITEFENETAISLSAQDLVLKIHVPFAKDNSGIFVNDKFYEFQMSPLLSIENSTSVKMGTIGGQTVYGKVIPNMINEGLSSDPEAISNAVKLDGLMGGVWIQGIDLKEQGMFPFMARGVNLVTKQFSTKISDLITIDANKKASDMNFLKVYVGVIGCLVFTCEGGAEISNTLYGDVTDFTMGVRYVEKDGSYEFTDLTTSPTLKIGDDFSCRVGLEGKMGVCAMVVASVAGIVPIGIGPEGGIKFDEAYAELSTSLKGDNKGNIEWSGQAEYSGNISCYFNVDLHTRLAVGKKNADKPFIELLPIDKTVFRKEWPIKSLESDEISLEIRNEEDEFQVCDEKGTDLKRTVRPVWDDMAGGWSFDCPEYILKDFGNTQKACKIVKLVIQPSGNAKREPWTKVKLSKFVTELAVNAKVSKDFSYTHGKPELLERLSLRGADSELDAIDVIQNTGLTALNIQGTAVTKLDIHKNVALRSLKINTGLLEFTGNGNVMPDKLAWFSDVEKTKPVTKCGMGQTIYSGPPLEEPGDPISTMGRLNIKDPSTAAYQVLDEYGTDISSTWPGYNAATGMVSPVLDESSGKYSIKVPQYIRIDDGTGKKAFKVTDFYFGIFETTRYSVIDCSEAPDITVLVSTTDYTGSAPEKIILPRNLQQFNCNLAGANNFACDFSEAPDLYAVAIARNQREESPLNLDFCKNAALSDLNISIGDGDLILNCPDGDSLEKIWIHVNGNSGTDNIGQIDFSKYPNLTSLYLNGADISEIDLSGLENLEFLSLSNMPIGELDLSSNLQLSELNIFELYVKDLDVSHNDNLTTLSIGNSTKTQQLHTFTGNGIVFPDLLWWSSKDGYDTKYEVKSCAKNETIYSSIYWQSMGVSPTQGMMEEQNEIAKKESENLVAEDFNEIIEEDPEELFEEVSENLTEKTSEEDLTENNSEELVEEKFVGENPKELVEKEPVGENPKESVKEDSVGGESKKSFGKEPAKGESEEAYKEDSMGEKSENVDATEENPEAIIKKIGQKSENNDMDADLPHMAESNTDRED